MVTLLVTLRQFQIISSILVFVFNLYSGIYLFIGVSNFQYLVKQPVATENTSGIH